MHIHTIVKVQADTEEDAIREVKNLVSNDNESLPSSFDWYDEDAIIISEECKTEEDFQKIRATEMQEYKENLRRYHDLVKDSETPDIKSMAGYYLRKAGECISPTMFWSTERFAYHMDWTEGKNIYYVETDRHF